MRRLSRSRIRAQTRALSVLGATLSLPGSARLTRVGRQPEPCETAVAGVAATVVRPLNAPPWPTLVFMNGATPDGRRHPIVHRLSLALARAGVCVVIPDLAGVAGGELSPATLVQAVAVSDATSRSPETADERVALVGVSVGGTLALLAAADSELQQRISVVTCVAPFGDLAQVMRVATTDTYRDSGGVQRHAPPPYLRIGLARSLAATLAATEATADLCSELRALDYESSAPVELPARAFHRAGDEAVRLYDLLVNRDPRRFDSLYAALPAHVRDAVLALSPIHVAQRLRAPVEIATAPEDKYFPVAEAQSLAAASPHIRLTITSLFAHATPRFDVRNVAELRRLYAFFARSFRAATSQPRLHSTAEQT